MSKNKHRHEQTEVHTAGHANEAEYRIIGKDLARVVVLNVLYLAAILIVYYTNHTSHYLENWFTKLFHW